MMRVPTLAEVLTNQAAPPYTLSAFMAFLSQNHCLETLEFTLDASRYQTQYYSLAQVPPQPGSEDAENLRLSWDRLINSYIRPGSPREVNLPSFDRDFLVRIPNTYTPPAPETLDSAVYKINELMRESVLSPFLQSCHEKVMQEDKQRQMLQQGAMYNDQMQYSNQGFQQRPSSMFVSNSAFTANPHNNTGSRGVYSSSAPRPIGGHATSGMDQFTPHYNGMPQSRQQAGRNQIQFNQQSNLTQMLEGHGRRLSRPGSTRPTSVPSADLQTIDSWSTSNDLDSDMSGSEDPITPPDTPPAGSSPTAGHGQWRSKIKQQFSKINGHRARSREPSH